MSPRHTNQVVHRSSVRVVALVAHLLREEEQRDMYMEVATVLKEELAVEERRASHEEKRLLK